MKPEIKTPRGTFKIEREFTSRNEAEENGYGIYFTNDDGTEIYTFHIDKYHCKFAIISKKKKITVTHNGMEIKFFKQEEEIQNFINETLKPHIHLNPEKIIDIELDDKKRIVIYEYHTMYKEMFLIETEEY